MNKALVLTVTKSNDNGLIEDITNFADNISASFYNNNDGTGEITIKIMVDKNMKVVSIGDAVDPDSLCIQVDEHNSFALNKQQAFVKLSDDKHAGSLNLSLGFNGKIGSTLGKTNGSQMEDVLG